MRLVPVMLALLLALSPGVVAIGMDAPAATGQHSVSVPADASGDSTTSVDQDVSTPPLDRNETTVLGIDEEPDNAGFASPTPSLGGTLAAERESVETEVRIGSLDRQLEAATTEEAKRRVLNRYRFQIENRVISLEAREDRAIAAYSNGSTSTAAFLRTLARIDAETGEIRTSIATLADRADAVETTVDARSLQARFVLLESPLRDRILRATTARGPSPRTYVATAETGIEVSMSFDDTFAREAIRFDNRDPTESGSMTLPEAESLVYDRYPWTRTPSGGTSTTPYGSTNVYAMTARHANGNLTAYVDGGTEQIFKEIRYEELDGETILPTGPAVSNESENVTVTVNRTYPGGPLRVTLTNATGSPLDGRVAIDGTRVGQTGPDGVLWTLGPVEQFQVSATHEFTTVNLTARPTETPDAPENTSETPTSRRPTMALR